MKSKNKPFIRETVESLGVDLKSTIRTVSVSEPPPRVGGVIVESVDELLAKLKEKGVLA